MPSNPQRQPEGGRGVNGTAPAPEAASTSAPTTPARQGRARHARTNASLTSSIASSSVGASTDAPFSPTDRLPRRSSIPNEASRIFQATGFDPFGTEPDTLFRSMTVKEVEAYERAVRSTAHGKQQELRGLVGQRYEDLLGTANTIIDMAGSSSQLSQRLQKLAKGVKSASSVEETAETSKKASRRKSFLPAQLSTSSGPDADASSLHQEAIYVLGTSLRLIMDAPEYVWKSIEKGKTLQAAWAFMLARATWWDLNETGLPSDSQSALAPDGEEGIASASQAVSLLGVNVKKAFPFIEKQWQSMLPMRKQIVHRAVALLSDAEIESMAVVDQLAALMLIDGTKIDQAVHLLLSQRLTAMRRMVQRQRRSALDLHHHTTSRDVDGAEIANRAAQTSQTMAQLVTLFARTLQHAVQIFALPTTKEAASSSRQPLLLDLLATITDSANFTTGTPAAISPVHERATLFPHPPSASSNDGTSARQNAAALRALRRRSNHGLPTENATQDVGTQAAADRTHPDQAKYLRVSTVNVVQALPSSRVLLRLLPPSLWGFAPFLDLENSEKHSAEQVMGDLSTWSTKAREVLIDGHAEGTKNHAPLDTLRTLLSELANVSELALVRRSLRTALHRARRIVARKLIPSDAVKENRRQAASAKVDSELEQLEEAIDSILQERLSHLMEQKLQHAVQALLTETGKIVSSLQSNSAEVDTPLDALFHPIGADIASSEARIDATAAANPTQASRTFAVALQDHVCGRSQRIDKLASLYETPTAALSQELKLYQTELEADGRFASASTSIRARFDNILADSRQEVEKGLMDLVDQQQSASAASKSAAAVSMSTSLGMRLIAVLALRESSEDAGTPKGLRQPVKAALERFWRPEVEQRVSTVLQASNSSSSSESSASAPLLCALATLSECIVQLGPALAGPELAEQVRAIIESLLALRRSAKDAAAAHDAVTLKALLESDTASLSKIVAKDSGLHRIRLALSPLLLALATTASGAEGKVTAGMALARAEPASAGGQVQPILPVSRKKVERFSMLPVR
ncbi:hypothetical protein NDA13_003080 [Ustilago tritici]|nr:hypothetical protein NDA13_003080 [Ustilago tritici]